MIFRCCCDPRSIAVVGGGAWCDQIVLQCQKFGFDGDLWLVHPKGIVVRGIASVPTLDDLPSAPDAVFLGVNRHVTVQLVSELAQNGGGWCGLFCFGVFGSCSRG